MVLDLMAQLSSQRPYSPRSISGTLTMASLHPCATRRLSHRHPRRFQLASSAEAPPLFQTTHILEYLASIHLWCSNNFWIWSQHRPIKVSVLSPRASKVMLRPTIEHSRSKALAWPVVVLPMLGSLLSQIQLKSCRTRTNQQSKVLRHQEYPRSSLT